MDAINADNLKNYFDQLRQIFDDYDFDIHPEAIYNMNETGMLLEPRPPKVVGKRRSVIKLALVKSSKSQLLAVAVQLDNVSRHLLSLEQSE